MPQTSAEGWNWETIAAVAGVVISLLALLRPEISRIFRGLFNEIRFIPRDVIEVGFSAFGPTLGLIGSLYAKGADQFVQEMHVKLVRKRDGASNEFFWAVLRPLNFASNSGADMQIATGFTMRAADARGVNIQFHDAKTRERFSPSLEMLGRDFRATVSAARTSTAPLTTPLDFGTYQRGSAVATRVYAEVDRAFYWEAGEFTLELTISTLDPQLRFRQRFTFSLNQEQVDLIRLNVVGAMIWACGEADRFNFVHPTIQELKV